MRVILFRVFLFMFFVVTFVIAKGQGVRDLRINEILVKNDSNYIDQYGVHSGWFELFNTGYSTADVGGCFVTNDINNPKKYRIPKGNPLTRMASRTYSLFYAYNSVDRGIFHVNFSLDEIGFLALFDQSGKILIDSVSYDIASQITDVSFGKMENVPLEKATWKIMKDPTPNAINYTVVEKTRAEKYAESDKHGFIITFTTMSVVFVVLFLLAVIFIYTGKYFKKKAETNRIKKEIQSVKKESAIADANELELAAIATALYLYFDDQHEVEQTGFWLNRQRNQQTPWSAKRILFKKLPIRK